MNNTTHTDSAQAKPQSGDRGQSNTGIPPNTKEPYRAPQQAQTTRTQKPKNRNLTEEERRARNAELREIMRPYRGKPRKDGARVVSVAVCDELYSRLQAARYKGDSLQAIIRMMLYMGLAEYERNARAGIHTAAQRAQQQAERDAQADAMQAERERQQAAKESRKRTRTAQPAAPAMLYLSGIPTTTTSTEERSNTDAEQANSTSSSPKP